MKPKGVFQVKYLSLIYDVAKLIQKAFTFTLRVFFLQLFITLIFRSKIWTKRDNIYQCINILRIFSMFFFFSFLCQPVRWELIGVEFNN